MGDCPPLIYSSDIMVLQDLIMVKNWIWGSTLSDRKKRILLEGSPQFDNINTSALTASGQWFIDYDVIGQVSQKYLPLDAFSISNMSTQTLKLTVGASVFYIPANSNFAKDSGIWFRNFIIENLGTSDIAENLIAIRSYRKPIDNDELSRRQLMGQA